MNKAEKFVSDLCTKSFFNIWSYANPLRKDSHKELCDVLIVCESNILIISVKEIEVKESGDYKIDAERWYRRAVEESTKQIYGAERQLESMTNVVRNDGELGIELPDKSERKIFRIAVALGSEGKYPYNIGDFGKGYIHVFDEESFSNFMSELDTITDFVRYLEAKESFQEKGIVLNIYGEENLLALYIVNASSFRFIPDNCGVFVVENSHWENFTNTKQYKAKKKADKISYIWDAIIQQIINDFLGGILETSNTLTDVDKVLHTMALEDRYSRRTLGKVFYDFVKKRIRSRFFQSPSNVPYVFLARPHGTNRDKRRLELAGRCYVIRAFFPDQPIVIGIATEIEDLSLGMSLDVVFYERYKLDREAVNEIIEFQEEMGYFKENKYLKFREDEFPEE